jgi:hypothetical protein
VNEGVFTHAVVDRKGNIIRLKYAPKTSNCRVANFKSDSDTLCAEEEGGQLVFHDLSGNKYEWIAELKRDHAQRTVEQFAHIVTCWFD